MGTWLGERPTDTTRLGAFPGIDALPLTGQMTHYSADQATVVAHVAGLIDQSDLLFTIRNALGLGRR